MMFIELNQGRQSGMAPCPISYEAIESYSRLYDLPLSAWQIEGIRRLDNVFLKMQAEQQNG